MSMQTKLNSPCGGAQAAQTDIRADSRVHWATVSLLWLCLLGMAGLAQASPQGAGNQPSAHASGKKTPVATARPVGQAKTKAKARVVAVKKTRQAQQPVRKARSQQAARRQARAAVARAPARKAMAPVAALDARPSYGRLAGLHAAPDPLDLASGVALVVDQDTNEVLVSKNTQAVLPIASLTKLMTALVVTEARQPLEDRITITDDDIDTEKGSHSRLKIGANLSRGEMLHLALMSSENRAANALGRYYPGGLPAFVQAMNAKARALGMTDSHFVEPTGLSSRNQSSARDLAVLVKEAYHFPLIRELSTSHNYQVLVGRQALQYNNTNSLVRSPQWDIGLQKTGYIAEAGRCLVMQAQMAGRKLIMVFLDSSGKHARIADAERVRKWLMQGGRPTS
jgi:D-alanyl-D-alanine endopeptidase (penicillin-binding protein 7)